MTDFNMKLGVSIRAIETFRKLNKITEDTRRGIRQAYFYAGKKTIREVNTDILRKPRHGRIYIRNGKRHVASVAGEAPANWTGALRKSLDFNVIGYKNLIIGYDDTVEHGIWMELGTKNDDGSWRVEPRPGLKIGIERNQDNGSYEKIFEQELRKSYERKGR